MCGYVAAGPASSGKASRISVHTDTGAVAPIQGSNGDEVVECVCSTYERGVVGEPRVVCERQVPVYSTVADIAGAKGNLVAMLAGHHPHLGGVRFDLPVECCHRLQGVDTPRTRSLALVTTRPPAGAVGDKR